MRYGLKWAEWLAEGRIGTLPAAIVMVALYCCTQIVVLPLLSFWAGTGVGVDDAEQLNYMQYFWAGYGGSQPPLYTWINWLAAHGLGTNIFTLKVVKYCVLFLAACSVYMAMRRLDYARMTAAAAMFGVFTIPQIVWEAQRALSHSVGVIGFCALLVLATVHLLERRSTIAYALFGLAAAASILTKYNDVFLVAALVAAAASIREFRGAILHPKLLISIGVAALALMPTAYWNAVHLAEFLAREHKFGIDAQQGHLAAAAIGAGKFIMAVFEFAVLPAFISALAFALAGLRLSETHPKAPAKEHLLWRTLAFGLAMLAILVLASGTTQIRSRWLLPVLLMLPLATAAYMDRLGPRGRSAQSLVIGAGAIAAILSLVASWYFQVNGGDGQAGVLRMDYASLYRDLTADGPVKTIVSDKPLIGNLRLVDKSLVTLDDEMPDFASLLQEPVVMLWLNKPEPDKAILDRIDQAGYVADGETRTVLVPEFRSEKGRRVVFVRLKKAGQAGTSGN